MVSFKSLAAATLAAAPTAMGYITGFTAPATGTAGSNVTATLQTASYSQNWDDFGIVWGLSTPEYACDTCVGTQIGFTTLTGKEGLTYPYTFTESVTIPAGTSAGDYILNAAIPHLVGASGTTGFSYYTANITIS
ncbi:hypothetical protein VP1G_01130 [Cytospora mali]|uniref:Uncharacterized protein n=1 Tax=Cytospora mali TaxID=578113 RepID=A0A194UQ34_CYTMA|nr:hypothetical protein VP1G_01130 [Valsa mali var. pyri (nom. inval.)]